ncbi:cbb3-type cytochrome oxidase assembly protein [Geomonas sp. RF6]|uniref:cbb3-type cytochrome oxidase assembly protein n=1 Tax=Geomonas sp. RF6 TaxID=2897342 RepID=UPI001E4D6585|nr:cbb3-type cytochrome oxidase assembly protein CcoS [Geomonas sp. RF6]UFS70369.1 cbb3-type cytochrome oxidase assembly protein [Geomonas sp. RF6]
MSHSPADNGTFIIIWIGFTVLMVVGISLVFLWGVRNRQFENQDRARHLPLWSGIPDDEDDDDDGDSDGGVGRRRG